MDEKLWISVDAGKYQTKAIAKYKGKSYMSTFRTKLRHIEKMGVELQPNSFLVQYNGQEYLLGDMVNESFVDYNLSKTSTIHKLSIYSAIVRMINKSSAPHDVEIKLAVSVPINTFKNSDQKEKFKQMVENNQRPIHLNVNQTFYSLNLINVVLTFEGMSEIYTDIQQSKQKNTIVIDIGGLNATFCTFKGINPLLDSMIVTDLGINVLKGKIGKTINEQYGFSVSQEDLEQIMRSGYFESQGEIVEGSSTMIEELKYDHFQQIVQSAKSHGYTFNMADIHFVGGGSITLRNYIKQSFPHSTIINNPHYSNCKSSLRILEIKNGK